MKLIRFGEPNRDSPGILLQDSKRLDVSAFTGDYDEDFFADDGLRRLEKWLERNASSLPRVPDSIRLGPPIRRPSKIVCIGLNYRDHAKESDMEIPKERSFSSNRRHRLSAQMTIWSFQKMVLRWIGKWSPPS